MNSDWQQLFKPHILERGFVYFCDDAVRNLQISDEVISAEVEGTEDYEVEINLDHGQVDDMSCTCPYAGDGNNCKHMAAVLFEWDNKSFTKKTSAKKSAKKENSIQSVVDSADISVIKKFLTSLLEEDDTLFIRFKSTVTKKITKSDMTRLKTHVDEIAERHMDRFGSINYYEAGDFEYDLSEVIDKDVRRIMDAGDYMNAFTLLNYIFDIVARVDIDDSDGESSMLMNEVFDVWVELQGRATLKDKQEMFRWFTAHLGSYENDWVEEYIEDILLEEFKEKEFYQYKMDFIQEKIRNAELENDEWHRHFYVGKWVTRYFALLNPTSLEHSEFQRICEKYWDVPDVRQYYIDLCEKVKNYDRALQVLDESLVLDKGYQGLVSDYQQKKKQIFLLQGNKEAYLSQLWDLILKTEPGNLKLYRELKQQYTPREWMEKREFLFKNLPPTSNIGRLYAEEKLLDRLLAFVQRSSLYEAEEYTDLLKEEYPKELLQKYRDEVEDMAGSAGSRNHYRRLVDVLHRMQKIQGGKEVVADIVAVWREFYRRRPAMMDELKNGKL